jgi:hypothetical protein
MKTINLVAAIVVTVITAACGKIPAAYTGKYVDRSSGTQLELKDAEGTLTDASGAQLKSKAIALSFDALSKGQQGIYLKADSLNKSELEVFWISPDLSTVENTAGFSVMSAEILYTKMDTKAKGKAQTLELMHCKDGKIMLDQPTKQWNGGCPAGSPNLVMERTAAIK